MRQGFSLVEMILTITISSFVVMTVVSSCYLLHNVITRLISKSQDLVERAKFIETLHNDVLNSDLFPSRPADDYVLEPESFSFYSGGRKVVYTFSEGAFVLSKEKIVEEDELPMMPDDLLEGFDDQDDEAREEALKKLMDAEAAAKEQAESEKESLMQNSELEPGEEEEEQVEMEDETFDFVKNCEFEYLDKDENVIVDEEFPYFCLMKMTFKDNRTIEYKIKL